MRSAGILSSLPLKLVYSGFSFGALATKPCICVSTFSTVNCGGMTPLASRSFRLSISWSNLRGNLASRAR